MSTVIAVENLTKQYDLGVIGTGTLSRDLNRWWARARKQPDPYTRIGQQDAFARIGESILALDDVSFTVQQGEVLGIIGRNGAGKSTLLKILSRVTAPSSGVVKVKGRIGSLLEVGTGFHPELTGRENVYLNGAILGMKKAEVARKFDEIVDFAGVEKFIDTPVKRYSSGMYVRLAFSVAAHLESEILIVDEVLAVGDAEFQKKCLGKMGDVASREGRTVLFVSHNMSAINSLCENSLLLEKGRIKAIDKTDLIVSIYLQPTETSVSSLPIIESNEIKIQKFVVFQKDIADPKVFVNNKPVFVEFNYEIKQEIFGLRIGFDVVTKNGEIVFRSFDDDISGDLVKRIGLYKSTCVIPENFFNSTYYTIYPRVTVHRTRWIYNDDSGIKFSIHSNNGVNSRYDDTRPGVIMPGLIWTVDLLEYTHEF